MKISFAKVMLNDFAFDLEKEGLKFSGNLVKKDQTSVKCEASITGEIKHFCDRCGDDIDLNLNEKINLLFSDGIYKDVQDQLENVYEFFDSQIDLDEVFISEIETYKSDYFYCEKCKNL
ncbi:MAG: hypothetical protein K5978_02610 [Campylobacter sp.]|nr:hypothetical protein [Campylobacter sp.]